MLQLLQGFRTLRDSFSPLRIRNFRVYLSGQAISLIGTWLQLTAQGWVVWQLSHSNAALGTVTMLGTLPILLLGPWAGAWADRLDRRRLLVVTQTGAMLLAFALALLVMTGAIQLWHLYVLSASLGVVTALDMPTQQAFLGDLSGMGQVRRAVVLNAMIIQVSRMVGPALAGFVIGALGVGTAFWLNGLSFLAVIASLLAVRSNQVHKPASGNPLAEYAEGLRFIGEQPRIQDLLAFTVIVTFFAMPTMNVLPAITTDVLHGDATLLGFLMSASGAGALIGALFVVPLVQALPRTGMLLGGAIVWTGSWLAIFSASTWLPLSALSIFFISLCIPVVLTTANGLIQVLAPSTMRARLLSTLLMVSFGVQPIAALVIGYSADHFGPPLALRINGLAMITAVLLLLSLRSNLRHWEANVPAETAGSSPVEAAAADAAD